jgi:hypothetical protein
MAGGAEIGTAGLRRREWRAPPRADGRSLPRAPTGDRERLGEQRGKKIACVEVARLAEAIWHVLTPNWPFAPAGRPDFLAA